KSRSARFFSSATSASVRNSLPSSAFGRSKGVALLLNQIPCRSGRPSGVRGGVQVFAAAVFFALGPAARVWPAAETGASDTTATTIARARNRSLIETSCSYSPSRVSFLAIQSREVYTTGGNNRGRSGDSSGEAYGSFAAGWASKRRR